MMLGKIGQAAKYINNDDSVKGVHPLTDEIKNILQSKHPAGREADQEVILEYTSETPQRVIYENITEDKVLKIARNMSGSGGPTLITPGRGSLRNYSKIDVRDSCWAQRDKGLSTSRAERLHHSNVPLYVLLH